MFKISLVILWPLLLLRYLDWFLEPPSRLLGLAEGGGDARVAHVEHDVTEVVLDERTKCCTERGTLNGRSTAIFA